MLVAAPFKDLSDWQPYVYVFAYLDSLIKNTFFEFGVIGCHAQENSEHSVEDFFWKSSWRTNLSTITNMIAMHYIQGQWPICLCRFYEKSSQEKSCTRKLCIKIAPLSKMPTRKNAQSFRKESFSSVPGECISDHLRPMQITKTCPPQQLV